MKRKGRSPEMFTIPVDGLTKEEIQKLVSDLTGFHVELREPTNEITAKCDRSFLREARHGDNPEAAGYLLSRMADHLETGKPVDKAVKNWLIEALRAIDNDTDANRALGMKPTRGKRPRRMDHKNTRLRDPLLALEVQREVAQGIQPTRNPTTTNRESACSIVADRHGFEEKQIETIYYRERPFDW